jgi:hypothetical protein
MPIASYFISPSDLWDMIGLAQSADVDTRDWLARVT